MIVTGYYLIRIDKAIDSIGQKDILMILIGNKVDCPEDDRQVSRREAENLASQLNIKYFETSAKENTNVTEVIEHLLQNIPEETAEVYHVPETSLINVSELDTEKSAGCQC